MKIAVISDTHGRLPSAVLPALRQADEIWHLGDVCSLALLQELRAVGPPLTAVLGNNDFGLDLPEVCQIERQGHRFELIHIPPPRIVTSAGYLLHGHTHVPRDEMVGGTRVLNPGSIGKANKGAPASWAWLEVFPQGVVWTLVVLGSENRR